MEVISPLKVIKRIKGESNDCSVISLSIALDVPYETIHDFFKQRGRENNRGCYFERSLGINKSSKVTIFTLFGKTIEVIRFPYYDYERELLETKKTTDKWGDIYYKHVYSPRMNVKKFINLHNKGTYVVALRDHVFTVKDSVVYDFTESQYREIQYVLKIWN